MQQTWTVGSMLDWATQWLNKKGSESARLDAQLLLGKVCSLDKVQLYVQFERPLGDQELNDFRELIKRRAEHEPVAYILGEKEFYGRHFSVSPGVLIPRPDTEHLIDTVLAAVGSNTETAPNIVDVGTGSGVIAVTLALELPNATLLAIDSSKDALVQATANAEKHQVRERVRFVHGNLLAPLEKSACVDVVVSNPPYLDDELMSSLAPDISEYEPKLALYGGSDGMELLIPLIDESARVLRPSGVLALEISGGEQARAVMKILEDKPEFENVRASNDYQKIPRIVAASRCKE
ncbi:MAG TPA: peptide chain release factor N(5)-glutamine methyltransferase [Myxococcales bacterium]|nr:peptide chain release factor N(5)-glutamine methyltransferase [Myxococcales bacterium]